MTYNSSHDKIFSLNAIAYAEGFWTFKTLNNYTGLQEPYFVIPETGRDPLVVFYEFTAGGGPPGILSHHD